MRSSGFYSPVENWRSQLVVDILREWNIEDSFQERRVVSQVASSVFRRLPYLVIAKYSSINTNRETIPTAHHCSVQFEIKVANLDRFF